MKREFKVAGYIIFVSVFCAFALIAGLAVGVLRNKKSLIVYKGQIESLNATISQNEASIKEKESDMELYAGKLDEAAASINSLEEEYIKAMSTIETDELLLSRVELLERDMGNSFLESDIFEKVVYLTFDDGPSSRTLAILDILDRYGVKATFFVNYHEDADEKGIYKMIVDKGHSIGNHTYDHSYPIDDWDAFLTSLFKMEDYIFEQTGVRTRIIRFPGGSNDAWQYSEVYTQNVKALTDLGYIYFDWNLSNHDADKDMGYIEAERMVELVKLESAGRDKIMLLMHDRSSKYSTVEALGEIIEYYKSRGFVFLPITPYSFNPQHFDISAAQNAQN